MFRVIDLTLHNFKGFKDAFISFDTPRTILGGSNGFGKTSVFDALELLFTGKIERMESYKPGHDNRTNLNNDYKPLVYDTSIADIVIEATIQLPTKTQIKVRRRAEQHCMKNPVDFKAFSNLQFFDAATGLYKDYAEIPAVNELFSSLATQYSFMNYLTQEEANSFIKCKEQDRKQQINSLFPTDAFDIPIEKLTLVRSEVIEIAQELNNEIIRLSRDAIRLQTIPERQIDIKASPEYIKLFDRDIEWDRVELQLSYESFDGLLKEGGLLDDLQYYALYQPTYQWCLIVNSLDEILQSENLDGLSLWLKWKDEEKALNQYGTFIKGIRREWEELSLSNVQSFSIDGSGIPEDIQSKTSFSDLQHHLTSLKIIVESAGDLQQSYANLLTLRDGLENALENEQALHTDYCPLCGKHFKTENALTQAIQTYGNRLRNNVDSISRGMVLSLDSFKTKVREVIIDPIDSYFHSLGIDKDLVAEYEKLEKNRLAKYYDLLIHQLSFHITNGNNQEELKQQILEAINRWKEESFQTLPPEFDFRRMQKVQNSYGRFLLPDVLTKESIDKKRLYLTMAWNASVSQLLDEINGKISQLRIQQSRLTDQEKKLKRTINKIKEQRSTYLSTMVNQMETLFYIYTGRIMQDNYYGRGCYLKYFPKNSVVLFTSGSYNNEVDAIYKMSSGQLVSISIAFMLTVNKLYARHHIIAIDDPVQTIDDLNLWGLMETLRHDFKDSFMILSTHEQDYGLLLADRFNKVGLETGYKDMSQLHNVRIVNKTCA